MTVELALLAMWIAARAVARAKPGRRRGGRTRTRKQPTRKGGLPSTRPHGGRKG